MNRKNINLIQQKYKGWFDDHVSCNLYHDPVTDQMNQYPVFYIKFYPLFKSLGSSETLESEVPSYSPYFIKHIEDKIELFINYVCENALK